ncbi:hypothetical protein JL101_036475 (plasmid) [Skermanella rosea]|uniref:hypothetical protein n=1 Tax=Skermanella rosea TaxID=1817965 RepID=UPI0019330573|nr:hypothetical protein [Skermanella rosea]UEM08240.1 hypothetical protein JL101_036475 [Skermanella rosea]
MRSIITVAALLALAGCASQPAVRDSLSITDYMRLIDAREQAFDAPVGQAAMWMNVLTGLGGTVTPLNKAHRDQGRTCRRFRQLVRSTDGRLDDREMTACRGPSGVLAFEQEE